jgi:hypothetical protein
MESQAIQKLSLVVITYLESRPPAGDIPRPGTHPLDSAIGVPEAGRQTLVKPRFARAVPEGAEFLCKLLQRFPYPSNGTLPNRVVHPSLGDERA